MKNQTDFSDEPTLSLPTINGRNAPVTAKIEQWTKHKKDNLMADASNS